MQIRDLRRKEKFSIDDSYINGYARQCGINATGVYAVLCRHVDVGQEAFPSIEIISDKLSISTRSVMRSIKKLESFNIIQARRRKTARGTYHPNVYTLLDRVEWKPLHMTHSHTDKPSPCDSQSLAHVTHSHLKVTHKKVYIVGMEKGSDLEMLSVPSVQLEKEFENLWGSYPLKDGKKAARRHFMATVKNEEDCKAIVKALNNYLEHLSLKSNSWKKPKNGSTWFNNWPDWVDFQEPQIAQKRRLAL